MNYQSFSLIEAPESAAIIFFNKCNMRCSYCYNMDLLEDLKVDVNEIKKFIESLFRTAFDGHRMSKVDYVVFSGGECTLHGKELYDSLAYSRENGLKTGVYTNGTNPSIIKDSWKLIDFINIDYKFGVHDYTYNQQISVIDTIKFCLLMKGPRSVRINTTVLKTLHTPEYLGGMRRYIERSMDEFNIEIVPMEEWNPLKTQWTLSPFFRGKGTLGNIINEETTKEERWNLIRSMK